MRTLLAIISITLLALPAKTQPADSVLLFSDYLYMVAAHHPVAVQADLRMQMGEAYLLKARGAFDPKIETSFGNKDFEDKNYYQLLNGVLKVPTRLGLELKAGIERNNGLFLDPENNTTADGLAFAGVSLPVGQGLFTDGRRMELQKARIYRELTVIDQRVMLNDILYSAAGAYLDWFMAYHKRSIVEEGLRLAEVRLEGVRQSAAFGDLPPIDTLEASIQVQNRQVQLREAEMELYNQSSLLETYLWLEGQVPLSLGENTIPELEGDLTDLEPGLPRDLITSISRDHPWVMQTILKQEQLQAENRWLKEQLKPELNLEYKALTRIGEVQGFNPQDYSFGLNFSIPLFLRKERGSLRLNKLKIQEAEMDILNKQAELQAKLQNGLNEWTATTDQMSVFRRTVTGYNDLAEAERRLFQVGESSLFMVNSREQSYIQSRIKLLEIGVKRISSVLKTRYLLLDLSAFSPTIDQ